MHKGMGMGMGMATQFELISVYACCVRKPFRLDTHLSNFQNDVKTVTSHPHCRIVSASKNTYMKHCISSENIKMHQDSLAKYYFAAN